MKFALWTAQILLALFFLAVGVMKLMMPAEALTAQMPFFPVLFVRFIAVCEILGAIGLVAPGLTHIRTELTPLAAAGLFIVMLGATVSTVVTMGAGMAILPAVAGILAAFVAYCRWQVAPLSASAQHGYGRRSDSVLQHR